MAEDDDTSVGPDPTELESQELATQIHEHLEATEQMPLDTATNRWLGEAEAVAADIAIGDVSEAVASNRAETIVELLESAGSIENESASEHVITSLTLARELSTRR